MRVLPLRTPQHPHKKEQAVDVKLGGKSDFHIGPIPKVNDAF